MTTLTLTRFSHTPDGTVGTLTLPSGLRIYTVEPPWRDNEPHISCIPTGTYSVHRDTTGKHRYWALEDVPGRSAIEIHAANFFINPNTGRQELHGCIAPGLIRSRNHPASVQDSRRALGVMIEELGDTPFVLNIANFDPARQSWQGVI